MTDLKFDIYAFSAPKTLADIQSLCKETLRVLDEISDQISGRERELEAYAAGKCTAA